MSKKSYETQDLAKNCNETLILAAIFNGKKHGYQLALEIESKSKGYFKFNHGTLYPILHKLEKAGHIKGSWRKDGSSRKRKQYSITAGGRKYLLEQLSSWREFFDKLFDLVGEVEI